MVADAVLADRHHHGRPGRLGPGHDRLGVLDADHVERAHPAARPRGPARRSRPWMTVLMPLYSASWLTPGLGQHPLASRSALNSPATGAAAAAVPSAAACRSRSGQGWPRTSPCASPAVTASPAPVGLLNTSPGGDGPPGARAGRRPQPGRPERDHDGLRARRPQLRRGGRDRRQVRPAGAGQRPAGQRLQLGQVRLDDRRPGAGAEPQRVPVGVQHGRHPGRRRRGHQLGVGAGGQAARQAAAEHHGRAIGQRLFIGNKERGVLVRRHFRSRLVEQRRPPVAGVDHRERPPGLAAHRGERRRHPEPGQRRGHLRAGGAPGQAEHPGPAPRWPAASGPRSGPCRRGGPGPGRAGSPRTSPRPRPRG